MRALFFLLFFTLISPFAYGEEQNAGIVQGLWYGEEKVFAEEATRVYVAVRNNTGSDLTGTIEFFDGERQIGRKAIQALHGHIVESWVDWTPTYGTHTLKANLSRIELHTIGEEEKEVEVISAIAEDTVFVDHDTDEDGTGNEADEDDDNDMKSDEDEKKEGSDPLTKDDDAYRQAAAAIMSEGDEPKEEDESTSASGLERYLEEGPAEEVLSNITQHITTTKEKIDAYRKARAQKREMEEGYGNGFGTVSTSTSDNAGIEELSLTDFFVSVFGLFKTIFVMVYTFLLTVVSFVLGHPMLVQVGTLLLILILIFRTAAKLGNRKRKI